MVVVPPGTELRVRLTRRLSSATDRPGQAFEATLDEDLMAEGRMVAPQGGLVRGELVEVVPSGKVKGRARMSLRISELDSATGRYPLSTNAPSFEAEGGTKQDALKVGIGAGVGAAIGAIAGGKKGAAIGTAIGGGTGTATVVLTRGEEVEFGSEHPFTFRLERALEVALR